MDECLKLADWKGFGKRAAASKKNGKLRGRGLCYFLEEAAIFNDRMELRFDPSGTVTIVAGTHSHGQGHATVYAQMVSEWLGVPFDNIRFVQGDTNAVPIGRGTYGSRSMHGRRQRAEARRRRHHREGEADGGAPDGGAAGDIEFKDGRFAIVGTDKAMALTDVAKAFYAPAHLPTEVRRRARGRGHRSPASRRTIRTAATSARSRSIPRPARSRSCAMPRSTMSAASSTRCSCEGQIHGGVAQGVGQALMEHVRLRRAAASS